MIAYRLRVRTWLGFGLVFLLGASVAIAEQTASDPSNRSAGPSGWELLGKGINYGNIFEAPKEGEWGLTFDEAYPKLIREAGFDSVRIPIRWSTRALSRPPYTIEVDFLARIQHVVRLNLEAGLKVILNIHHYEELYDKPEAERERFLSLWRQLSEAFAEADDRIFFEILNEPHANLKATEWNRLLVDAIELIRERHPKRWLILGPDFWNNLSALPRLELPEEDRRIIVTVHYYLPFPFTHQGASWVQPALPEGVRWTGTEEEVAAMERDFAGVAEWAIQHQRPIYVGEFGAFEKADMASRVAWTRSVRRICEKHGFSWGYWELASGFGALDRESKQWKQPLVDALTR